MVISITHFAKWICTHNHIELRVHFDILVFRCFVHMRFVSKCQTWKLNDCCCVSAPAQYAACNNSANSFYCENLMQTLKGFFLYFGFHESLIERCRMQQQIIQIISLCVWLVRVWKYSIRWRNTFQSTCHYFYEINIQLAYACVHLFHFISFLPKIPKWTKFD